MQLPEAIRTIGVRGLPPMITDIPGALLALQMMDGHARSSPDWRRAWESVWSAKESRAPDDIKEAGSAMAALLRKQKYLAVSPR